MDLKKCKICGRELPFNMFDENRHQCKDCRKAYRKQRRKEHPEIHNEQSKRRQKRIIQFLHSLKTPCIICGESEPCCIDFHHINPSDKNFTIGKKIGSSKEKLLEEISKCVCVCSNCHRKIHFGLINVENYIINKSPLCTTEEGVTE